MGQRLPIVAVQPDDLDVEVIQRRLARRRAVEGNPRTMRRKRRSLRVLPTLQDPVFVGAIGPDRPDRRPRLLAPKDDPARLASGPTPLAPATDAAATETPRTTTATALLCTLVSTSMPARRFRRPAPRGRVRRRLGGPKTRAQLPKNAPRYLAAPHCLRVMLSRWGGC